MLDELCPAAPSSTLEVVVTERLNQQLRLVQPRGMSRREAGPPPVGTTRPVICRGGCRMAGIVVLDQEYPLQPSVPAAKRLQFPEVVLGVLAVLHSDLHPSRVNDEEEEQVDCSMPDVLELLLLDGTGDRPPDGATLQH